MKSLIKPKLKPNEKIINLLLVLITGRVWPLRETIIKRKLNNKAIDFWPNEYWVKLTVDYLDCCLQIFPRDIINETKKKKVEDKEDFWSYILSNHNN